MRVFSGMSMRAMWQMILSTARHAGGEQMTKPRRMSSVPHPPPSLMRTFSPGRAALTGSSLAQTASILYCWRVGISVTFMPGRTVPLSTLPMAMVPRSVYRSRTGMRSAALASLPLISRASRRPRSVETPVLFSLLVWHPFHQGQTLGSTSSLMLAPVRPEMGMNFTSLLITKPQDLRKGLSFVTHSSNRDFCHLTVGSSILLMTTMRYETPSVLARRACSLV
mmetsp:Transcript_26225/g.53750  ORF Transcript_26225/g.53750 Transcript_26225/m.53750 type:complete len:223 (-) Transcript_26225:1051-1719(-)